MVDLTAISGAAGALKAAYDLSKAALGLHDAALLRGKITEMQGEISSALASAITAQTDQMAMLERIRNLEKEMADFKNWEADKQRYELKAIGSAFAYMLKPDERGATPPHWICANCYGNSHAVILQFFGFVKGQVGHFWSCPSCKTNVLPSFAAPQWLD